MRSLVLNTFQQASFRGVKFLFNDSSQTGGRKMHTFEYPNQDTRYVQDLGQRQRIYKITAVIFQNDANYINAKNQLVDSLEQEGPGLLVHPTDGVKTVFAGPYTVVDSLEKLGVAEFNLTFYETGEQVYPQTTTSNPSTIAQQIDNFLNDVNSDFAKAWSTISIYQGSVEYSASLLDNMINNFKNAAKIATNDQDAANGYTSIVKTFESNKYANIFAATDLASGVGNVFDSMGELSTNTDDRYTTVSSFFSYAPETNINQTTVSLEQQEKNRVSADLIINSYALIYAYLFTTQTTFATETDIELRNQILDEQFFFIIDSNFYVDIFGNRSSILSVATLDLLQNLRFNAHSYLRDQINNSRKVITITVPRDSLLSLTYRYYGNLDLIETLAELNDTVNLSDIRGDYKVLTDES